MDDQVLANFTVTVSENVMTHNGYVIFEPVHVSKKGRQKLLSTMKRCIFEKKIPLKISDNIWHEVYRKWKKEIIINKHLAYMVEILRCRKLQNELMHISRIKLYHRRANTHTFMYIIVIIIIILTWDLPKICTIEYLKIRSNVITLSTSFKLCKTLWIVKT